MSEQPYTQPWCDQCGGDGASWLPGKRGMLWAVQDVRETSAGWLCRICRQFPEHGVKAWPPSKNIPNNKRAA